jgi:hypothetical protein
MMMRSGRAWCSAIDRDGYANLVVGAAGENNDRGQVTVIHGAAGGRPATTPTARTPKVFLARPRGVTRSAPAWPCSTTTATAAWTSPSAHPTRTREPVSSRRCPGPAKVLDQQVAHVRAQKPQVPLPRQRAVREQPRSMTQRCSGRPPRLATNDGSSYWATNGLEPVNLFRVSAAKVG